VGVLPTKWRQCSVSERFTHKTAAWESCLEDGGVSGNLTYKMEAWVFCLQDGGVSESFTYNMVAWKICLQDGGNAAFRRVFPQDGDVGDLLTRWRRF